MSLRISALGWVLPAFAVASLSAAQETPAGTKVFDMSDNTWFEGNLTQLEVAPGADRALFHLLGHTHLVNIATGREDSAALAGKLDKVDDAAFCGGTLVRRGRRGIEHGWFLSDGPDGPTDGPSAGLPDDAVLSCSYDGKQLAYYRASAPRTGVFVGPVGAYRAYLFPGDVSGTVFAPDGRSLYATYINDHGVSSLVEITLPSGQTRVVASDLDMMPGGNVISMAPDGRHLYVALASAGAPQNAARHDPQATRFLQIYALDAATGARQRITSSLQDNYDPNVVGHTLYWARVVPHKAVAVIPAKGGEAREVLAGADLPMWSPDGRRISYTYDFDRMADGALPMDVGVISVDHGVHVTSKPAPFVTGYHEDFTAAWSPDGKWIAFHSHRPPTPVPFYESPGHTDDIYLRVAEDRHAPEIRLTDFGWEVGPAYWAPDGRRLMFSGWEKGGTPRIDRVWILTIDPVAGRTLRADRLPLPAAVRSASWAMWSPDGKHVVIEDNQGSNKRSLWVLGADGSDPRKLVDYRGTTYDAVDWSPDGKTIVYSGLVGDLLQLFAIPSAGGEPRQLTHDSENILHPRFSPDGRWIACSRLTKEHIVVKRALGQQLISSRGR